jgi:uncharacterized protein YegJ (DUF2314 family)
MFKNNFGVEVMKVKIIETLKNSYVGILNEHPCMTDNLKLGDEIVFNNDNIVNITN